MSFAAKTDLLGLATTGLELVANAANASNQNLEIPGMDGAIIHVKKFGSVKAPHCDYKITGELSSLAYKLGKVHTGDGNTGPWALKSIQIHTGAGDEPTFGADGVQLKSGATQAVCTFSPHIPALSPARHASTCGAFTFTESESLTLQSCDYTADCELDPTTINGLPVAADAVKAYEQVVITMWTNSDATEPTITIDSNWQLHSDWDCTGADSSMFVWTATLRRYLPVDTPAA